MRTTHLLLRVFLSGLFLLTLTAPGTAQVEQKKDTKEEIERQQELTRKTLSLLDEVVAGASGLKLAENRTFILASAANLMWNHDEKRARNLFWEALNTLNLMNAPATGATSPGSDKAKLNNYFEIFGQRREILRVVAKRDPQLALDLLRATRQTAPDPVNSTWRIPDERDLEQQIATAAAERDPKRALQLARESLAKGLSLELINLLFQVNQKDAELGTKLAGDIIDKIRAGDIATDLNAPHVAVSLLEASRPARADAQPAPASLIRRLNLEEDQRRGLVESMANAALSVSASPSLLFAISEVLPEIEQFAPERVLLLKNKLAAFQKKLPQREQRWQDHNTLLRSGTPEEILRASTKLDDDDRAWLEREAIIRAVFLQKADSLREFVDKELSDDSHRKTILDSLDSEEIDFVAHRGSPDNLRKLLPKIRLKEQRARAMAQIAILLEKKGEHEEALSLLDEAQRLIKTDLQSESQSNALLGLVLAYAFVEPARAFAIIEKTVDRANDDISKALLVDKVIKTGFVKKGEIILNASGSIPMEFAAFKYGKGVVALAAADFTRTRAIAERFHRPELRIMARLLIAQSLLGGESLGSK